MLTLRHDAACDIHVESQFRYVPQTAVDAAGSVSSVAPVEYKLIGEFQYSLWTELSGES